LRLSLFRFIDNLFVIWLDSGDTHLHVAV
jgi:hypothetical protein